MDKFDRFQLLHRLFRSHKYPISRRTLAEKLECSEKTIKRAIDSMCDNLGAPIEYSEEYKGWYYNEEKNQLYELPGLWLTSHELQSLTLLLQLLNEFGSGLLNDELAVIGKYINKALTVRGIDCDAFQQKIKVLPLNNRYIANTMFAQVCEATVNKQQIHIRYKSYNHKISNRTLSPQNLIYYRENWYLDAYCHLRKDLRTFSLARIEHINIELQAAKSIPQKQLQQHFSNGYGIFSGQATHTAKLRFSPQIAREISMQQWHPDQTSEWDGGDLLLNIPYSNDKELIQDILRHMPNVIVEAPAELKKTIKNKLQQGLERYLNKGLGWL